MLIVLVALLLITATLYLDYLLATSLYIRFSRSRTEYVAFALAMVASVLVGTTFLALYFYLSVKMDLIKP
jgi:hypothetical protein